MEYENPSFGIDRFREWAEKKQVEAFGKDSLNKYAPVCDVWDLKTTKPLREPYDTLFDHGFLVDRAPRWGYPDLVGSEIALISRSYCREDEVHDPPEGLQCVRLPDEVLGDYPGIPIATVISDATIAALEFLNLCRGMDVDMFPYALSKPMTDEGYYVSLKPTSCNFPEIYLNRYVSIPDAEL